MVYRKYPKVVWVLVFILGLLLVPFVIVGSFIGRILEKIK